MRLLRRWDRLSRRAAVAAVAAAVVCAGAAAGALHIGPAPSPPDSTPSWTGLPPSPDTSSAGSDSAAAAAVATAPFREARTPPEARYRVESRDGAGRRDPALGRLRLVGTAAHGAGAGLAAFELDGRDVRVLRTGQRLEGHRLLRVEPGTATLEGADTTVVLRVRRPGGRKDAP